MATHTIAATHTVTVSAHMTAASPRAIRGARAWCSCGWFADRGELAAAHSAGVEHVRVESAGKAYSLPPRPPAGRGPTVPEGWTLDDDGVARTPAGARGSAHARVDGEPLDEQWRRLPDTAPLLWIKPAPGSHVVGSDRAWMQRAERLSRMENSGWSGIVCYLGGGMYRVAFGVRRRGASIARAWIVDNAPAFASRVDLSLRASS